MVKVHDLPLLRENFGRCSLNHELLSNDRNLHGRKESQLSKETPRKPKELTRNKREEVREREVPSGVPREGDPIFKEARTRGAWRAHQGREKPREKLK